MKTLEHTSLHQQLVTSFFQHFGHYFMYFPEEVEDTYIYNESGNFCFFQSEKLEEILKENGNIIAYRTIPENDECEEHSAAWGFLAFIDKNDQEGTEKMVVAMVEIQFHGMFGVSVEEMSTNSCPPMKKAYYTHLLDTLKQGSFSTRDYRVIGLSEERWNLVDAYLDRESISLEELIMRFVQP